MQPSAPSLPDVPPAPQPPAAPSPVPAQAPAPVAGTIADVPIPVGALPRTAQEVRGLRERRDILRDQLERATNRRDQLVGELQGEGDRQLAPEARAGIQQRLQVLDERIIQIERDQAATERLLSNAPPAVLAGAAAESRQLNDMVDEDEAVFAAFSAFGFGVLLTLVISRVRRRFARRRGGAAATATVVAEDPRIDRLTQAVDAIAEEVERIGEGQRFVTQLLATRGEAPALGEAERR